MSFADRKRSSEANEEKMNLVLNPNYMSHNTFLPQKSVPGLFLKNCEPHGNIKDQISYLLPKQLGTLLKIPMN